MSYTTVKIIETGGRFTDIAELSNSWGSAAFVWSVLAKIYLGDESALFRDSGKEIWALVDDARLSKTERIVLASTFDHAIIEHARFADAAKVFREFSHSHAQPGVNHLPTIARLLDEWKDKPCVGMCFHQTSVSENPWHGGYDEEAEAYKPYDLQTDDRHFFVFAEYERPAARANQTQELAELLAKADAAYHFQRLRDGGYLDGLSDEEWSRLKELLKELCAATAAPEWEAEGA